MENKFIELLKRNGQVSLMNDILPMVLDEFQFEEINAAMCESASEFVAQLIYSAAISGINTVCLVRFKDTSIHGELSLADMIYKVV